MKREIINEIIQLKERKKILEAEMGILHEDVHIFSRQEKEEIKRHLNEENIQIILEAINERLKDDEVLFQHQIAVEMSEGRSENWNRELEGTVTNESVVLRIHEREHIFN